MSNKFIYHSICSKEVSYIVLKTIIKLESTIYSLLKHTVSEKTQDCAIYHD